MQEINCPKACGKCCEVVSLSRPKSEGGIELRIILSRISRKKAIEISPESVSGNMKRYYYTCNMFDKKNRKCMIYNGRPYMCRYYPFYDKSVVNAYLLYKDCYWGNQLMQRRTK